VEVRTHAGTQHTHEAQTGRLTTRRAAPGCLAGAFSAPPPPMCEPHERMLKGTFNSTFSTPFSTANATYHGEIWRGSWLKGPLP
jgi:hypothetical protein